MAFTDLSAATMSGSIRFREVRAFLIHRGGIFARNLVNPRTAEPELDEKSLASRGMQFASSFISLNLELRNHESFPISSSRLYLA
jgi:hypothetical protein